MICYDVPAKRTDLYKKLLKEFLVHEQASVFMGDISESDVIRMVAKIAKMIGPEDRVLKVVCKNRHNAEVSRFGKEALGGQMRQEEDAWHGKNWSLI